ncbi:MAG: hypothetical protein AAF938_25100 [Myxococcota bacterium]
MRHGAHRQPIEEPAVVEALGNLGSLRVYEVETTSIPVGSRFLVVAFPVDGGFRFAAFDLGLQDDSGGTRVEGFQANGGGHGLLRANVAVRWEWAHMDSVPTEGDDECYLSVSDAVTRSRYALLCDAAAFECSTVLVAEETLAPASVSLDGQCDGVDEDAAPEPREAFVYSLNVLDRNQVELRKPDGTAAAPTIRWRETSALDPVLP